MKTLLLTLLPLLVVAACKSGPREITAEDEQVVSAGLDVDHFPRLAGEMANKLLTNSFLNFPPYQGTVVRMVLSEVDNRTDLRNLPTNQITGRVRSALLNSGRVSFVATMGEGERDTVAEGAQDAVNDPRFNKENVPEQGSLTFPQVALKTVIDFHRSSDGSQSQNNYVLHMFATDIKTGEIRWEDFSEPVRKVVEGGGVGW